MELKWDLEGERFFETGVDHGALYLTDPVTGAYDRGFPWNGIVSVSESPTGAEANPQYADNIKYLNLRSAEEFVATLEAFTYPPEFEVCDGSASPVRGLTVGQQNRETFGLSYRTKVGNDLNPDLGYKLHLVYGAQASPSEKAYTTINDSPEAITFSWELTTNPVEVPGLKPSATLVLDSTLLPAAGMALVEDILYGRGAGNATPRLPRPAEIIDIFSAEAGDGEGA